MLLTLLGVALTAVAAVTWLGFASLPEEDTSLSLPGLVNSVRIEFDNRGIPRIQGKNRTDVFQALGLVTAQDRLFQMDLLRRSTAGRLAEIFGPELLPLDRWNRILGYEKLSSEILARLPAEQRSVLRAYARGVNQALAGFRVLPFEFLLLGYRPEPWREEDSLLVMLGMHAMLTGVGDQERTVTVMDAVLPPAAVAFFTPDIDPFSARLLLQTYAPESIPVTDLKSLLAPEATPASQTNVVNVPFLSAGSNAWLVAPSRTHDGRALLANDMHLRLGVPNLWYRAELYYRERFFVGLTLPGIPLPISGSNGRIAWGFTNIQGDFSDLILLQERAEVPGMYWTDQGWRPFGKRWETIRVKRAADQSLLVRTTEWGPVLPQRVLGQEVAIRWTALDPAATDLGLLKLDRAATVSEAIAVFNHAGGAPLNVLVADQDGNIGWTLMGKLPLRRGFSGRVGHSWAQKGIGWRGYVAPAKLPRLLNPPDGYIVSANQRMVGEDFPAVIGHDYANGYRAYRISRQLRTIAGSREEDMLALQLDTRAGFYEPYRKLALEALKHSTRVQVADAGFVASLRRQLEGWDGRAEVDSEGFAVLVEFRRTLAGTVLSPFLERCRAQDENFVYAWKKMDIPLLRLVGSKLPELLPYPRIYESWDDLIAAVLLKSAYKVMEQVGEAELEAIRWGDVNRVNVVHPFSQAIPWLRPLLDMPESALAGCDLCVRVGTPIGGATERLVVSPGREREGILHMPGGQSGHPLSSHYRDQQQAWLEGRPTPLLTGTVKRALMLRPSPVE